MKLSKIFLLAGAAVALAGATMANATVYVGLSTDGGAIVTKDSGSTLATWTGTFGVFDLTSVLGTIGSSPTLLNSSVTVNKLATAAAHTLDVWVTRTNLGSFTGTFKSGFTSNVLTNGWTLTEYTGYDTGNGIYTGTTLSSAVFPAVGSTTGNVLGSVTGPFSVTHLYHFEAGKKAADTLSTVSLQGLTSAVPEPATWALMLSGFGLAGLTLRSRASKYKVDYAA